MNNQVDEIKIKPNIISENKQHIIIDHQKIKSNKKLLSGSFNLNQSVDNYHFQKERYETDDHKFDFPYSKVKRKEIVLRENSSPIQFFEDSRRNCEIIKKDFQERPIYFLQNPKANGIINNNSNLCINLNKDMLERKIERINDNFNNFSPLNINNDLNEENLLSKTKSDELKIRHVRFESSNNELLKESEVNVRIKNDSKKKEDIKLERRLDFSSPSLKREFGIHANIGNINLNSKKKIFNLNASSCKNIFVNKPDSEAVESTIFFSEDRFVSFNSKKNYLFLKKYKYFKKKYHDIFIAKPKTFDKSSNHHVNKKFKGRENLSKRKINKNRVVTNKIENDLLYKRNDRKIVLININKEDKLRSKCTSNQISRSNSLREDSNMHQQNMLQQKYNQLNISINHVVEQKPEINIKNMKNVNRIRKVIQEKETIITSPSQNVVSFKDNFQSVIKSTNNKSRRFKNEGSDKFTENLTKKNDYGMKNNNSSNEQININKKQVRQTKNADESSKNSQSQTHWSKRNLKISKDGKNSIKISNNNNEKEIASLNGKIEAEISDKVKDLKCSSAPKLPSFSEISVQYFDLKNSITSNLFISFRKKDKSYFNYRNYTITENNQEFEQELDATSSKQNNKEKNLFSKRNSNYPSGLQNGNIKKKNKNKRDLSNKFKKYIDNCIDMCKEGELSEKLSKSTYKLSKIKSKSDRKNNLNFSNLSKVETGIAKKDNEDRKKAVWNDHDYWHRVIHPFFYPKRNKTKEIETRIHKFTSSKNGKSDFSFIKLNKLVPEKLIT